MLLRIIFRDRFFPFNLNFYIPPLVTGILGVTCVTFSHVSARFRAAIALFLLLSWLPNFFIDQPRFFSSLASENAPADFNVLSYNVKSYSFGSNKVIPFIAQTRPDILCLVEGTFRGRAPDNVKKALGDEYHWAVGYTLSIASRFPIIESKQVAEVRDIKVIRAVLQTPRGAIAVYDVDVKTPPFRSDQKAFDELYAAIADEKLPAIVVGDFNTPRGSYHVNRAMTGWRDSFSESSTDRYLATW
ncbi:MAG: endonuclease/exonuclease/phosphatase family protein, partial [Candidatus Sumerlaeota bacterium]